MQSNMRQPVTRDQLRGPIEVPQIRRRVDFGHIYSRDEWMAMELGYLPGSMDQKWFMFVENETLFVLRTWSAWLFAEAYFERQAEERILTHFLVPGTIEQSDEELKSMLLSLIERWLLGKDPG